MRKTGLLALVLGMLGVLALVIVSGQEGMINRDWFTYWAGGRGLLEGANLYRTEEWFALHTKNGSTWFPNPVFIYAPPTAILFAPLAVLPVSVAAVVWVWLSEIFITLSAILVLREGHWKRALAFMPYWVIGVALFLPVVLTLLMGQASALVLLLVVCSAALWNRGKWFGGGLLLGLTVIKPQPILFLFPLVGLWLILRRRWSALAGLGGSLGLSAVASLLLFPGFVQDWQIAVSTKVGGVAARMPTLWGLTTDALGTSPVALGVAVALGLLILSLGVLFVLRWTSADVFTNISALLLISLVLSPYLWNYDQILLLLPLLVALVRLDLVDAPFWVVALVPLGLDAIAMVLFAIAALRLEDTLSVGLPALVGVLLWSANRR